MCFGTNYLKKRFLIGIEFPKNTGFEDEFVTYKLFRNSKKIVSSNQILYAYTQIGNYTYKRSYNEHRLDILKAYENYMKFFKEMNSPYMLERAGKRYLRIMLIIRKEISTFDIILENKEKIIEDLDKRFISIYKYLNYLSSTYSYLADTKNEHKNYFNEYNVYLKTVNSFNKKSLRYGHNQSKKNLL